MFVAYVIVTIVAAAANFYAATNDFIRRVAASQHDQIGVPESGLPILGALKAAGALGLLVGNGVPVIRTAAAVGLHVFFRAAIITHLRAHDHSFGLAVGFLLLAGAALLLGLYARRPVI